MDKSRLENISKDLKTIWKELDANNDKLEKAREEYLSYISNKKSRKANSKGV